MGGKRSARNVFVREELEVGSNDHIEDPGDIHKDKRSGDSGDIRDGGIKRSRIGTGRAERLGRTGSQGVGD